MTASSFEETATAREDGVIALWHGSLSDIPPGWVLADGYNGAPDLLDTFLKAPSQYSDGPGSTGGSHTINLSSGQLPSHDHGGGVFSGGNHNHVITGYTSYGGSEGASLWTDVSTGQNYTATFPSAGSHSHGNGSTSSAGAGADIDNRPHHYEAAIIYKL